MTRIHGYDVAPADEKRQLIAQLLNSLLLADETSLLIDKGGVLTDAGSLAPEINEIISHLETRPHPPAIIISPRMIPRKLRRPEDDVSYLAVGSLKRDSTERLILRLLKDQAISVTDEALIVDILVSVLIKKHGDSAKNMSEINDMFDKLEEVGEEEGRSFFTTRKAEFEHLWGDNKVALRLIENAIGKTPKIFDPRRLHAEILLKDGNKSKANEVIRILHDMVNLRNSNERRTNYRLYLDTYAHYLTEIGKYDEAKKVYKNRSIFTEEERQVAVRDIEIVQSYKTR